MIDRCLQEGRPFTLLRHNVSMRSHCHLDCRPAGLAASKLPLCSDACRHAACWAATCQPALYRPLGVNSVHNAYLVVQLSAGPMIRSFAGVQTPFTRAGGCPR